MLKYFSAFPVINHQTNFTLSFSQNNYDTQHLWAITFILKLCVCWERVWVWKMEPNGLLNFEINLSTIIHRRSMIIFAHVKSNTQHNHIYLAWENRETLSLLKIMWPTLSRWCLFTSVSSAFELRSQILEILFKIYGRGAQAGFRRYRKSVPVCKAPKK